LVAFFGYLKGQEALRVEQAGLKTLQDEAMAAKRRFGQGVSSRLDLDRAKLAVSQQQATVAGGEAALGTAERRLGSLLGTAVVGELVFPPSRAMVEGDLPALAQAQRPEVQAARFEVRAAKAELAAAEVVRRWPAIGPDLMAGWDPNGPLTSVPGQFGWSAGISLTVPIYSGGAGAARVEQARQTEAMREADLQALLRTMDLAIADDRAASVAAAQQQDLADQEVQLAQEELRMSRFGFEQGSVPLIEVLRTEQAAIQASASLASARLDLELSRYRLAWDVGAQLP
ncbi:MAG: TolC family protein, partial [Cyanobacteria bacterium REEB65]|nr:TolC family protein [Cyanobacteria bacterium REEB65]